MTSNKTKYLEAQKETKQSNNKWLYFFLGRMYFTSNDRSQNMFIYLTNT